MKNPEKIEAVKAKLRDSIAAVERSQAHPSEPHEDACLISAIKAARDAESMLVKLRNYR